MLSLKKLIENSPAESFEWISRITQSKKRETHFLTLLAPLFAYAATSLKRLPIVDEKTILDFIYKDLVQLLLPMISRVCVYEMHVASKKNKLNGETPEARFDYFVSLLGKAGTAVSLFEKYPILERSIETVYQQYLDNQNELMQRLSDDYEEICQSLFEKKSNYKLIKMISAGDRHNRGHAVAVLEFSDGKKTVKTVYKPRPLQIDLAFQALIGWFNQKSSLQLHRQKIIAKPEYGWCEFISYDACKNENEVTLFYQRMGALLGISHLLASVDIHAENIIAHGSYPVFIDFECTLRPVFEDKEKKPLQEVPPHLVSDTLLLPVKFMSREDYNGLDLSGIAAPDKQESPYRRMQWAKIGTDEMYLVREKSEFSAMQNAPKLNQKVVDPSLYEKEITDSFVTFYRLIMENKKELFGDRSPLNAFCDAPIRVLFRATAVYSKLLVESYHPLLFHDKEKRLDHFSWLESHAKPLIFSDDIVKVEISDLLSNNIPYFSCTADGSVAFDSNKKPLSLDVRFSGLDRVKRHLIHHFNEDDLRLQLAIIENSFASLQLDKTGFTVEKKLKPKIDESVSTKKVKNDALMLAQKELDQLMKYVIVSEDQIMWPCVEMVGVDAWSPGFTDIELYNGIAGISLVFAYAASIYESKSYETIACFGLNSLLEVFSRQKEKSVVNVGVFSGLGGLIYTLAALNRLMKDKRIPKAVDTLLTWADGFIEEDKILDIISGSAGFIPSLFAARELIATDKLTPLVKKAAQHILTNYPNPEILPTCYENPISDQPLLGFSHGIAGFVWALAKANRLLADKNIEQWIKSALAYERRWFNKEKNNWPDFRTFDRKHFQTRDNFIMAWCHGAPGIGLARLDMRDDWNDEMIDQEIDQAIQATLKDGFGFGTNLCHGDLGNLDLLLEANHKDFYRYAAFEVERIKNQGPSFQIKGTLPMPGLMTGVAGVAYQLMRIASPVALPSVLLLK